MKKIFYSLLILLLAGCKEKYISPFVSPETGYLVVEGSINAGQGVTSLTLSRTTKLDNRNVQYELGAQVKVEGDDNSLYNFFETGVGQYTASNLNLNNTRKYRINIKTSSGKEYISDFVPVKTTPPVDSISWKRENGGVQFYINTHDPLDNTRYYQWEYTETWEFHSFYRSTLTYQNNNGNYSVAYKYPTRTFDSSIFTCWQNSSSKNLLLGSSAKLTKDVIYLPLTYIPPGSQKLTVLYSINVKQYGWTKTGYEFLERMKKNTESTGSVFDPQPSELNGNIRCVSDPAEPVIGYINISLAQEMRIFIKSSEVPGWAYITYCPDVVIDNKSDSIKVKGIDLGLIPTTAAKEVGGIVSFFAAAPYCVDCTLSGSNIKPVFWP
jgi:hypothetical protein